MKKIFRKNSIKFRTSFSIVLFFCLFSILFVGDTANGAAWDEAVAIFKNLPEILAITLIGIATQAVIAVVGGLLTVVSICTVAIAQYNDFIHVSQIEEAWGIVRDMCNMFFILILLIISFATILRVESYSMKKWLPKLVIMAVLINFSKMFCGLIIDFSQIVMLTFSSKISNGAEFYQAMEVQKYLNNVATATFDNITKESGVKFFDSAVGLIAGSVFLIVSLVVMTVILATLIARIVMLWIYIVLSPLAFVLSAFPGGQKYAGQWWSDFTKQVIVGPVLMFFVWLSLIMTNSMEDIGDSLVGSTACASGQISILCPDNFIGFILAIGMLMGGLIVASQIGGAAGGAAGRGISWAKKGAYFGSGAYLGVKGTKWAGEKAWGGARAGTKAVGRASLALGSTADRLVGKGIDKISSGKLGLGGEGLVKKTAQGVWNAPGNVGKWASDKFNKDGALDKARRSVYKTEPGEATMKYSDREWKKDHNKEFYQVDSNGGEKLNKDGNRTYLENNGERVKEMGAFKASFLDAWNSSQSGARATSNKAQEESIQDWQKKISDSGMSETDMLRQMKDTSISKDKKMALAMTLAIKKGFKDLEDVKAARKTMGSNHILSGKLNEEIDKNQAHIAYDFESDAGKEKFKNRIDSGKIDSTKLSSDAYSNDHVLEQLQDYHGKNFKKVMETSFKRGKKYEASISKGLVDRRNSNTGDKKYDMASLHAKLTGNPGESFGNVGGGIDIASMQKYFRTAKAADINKISTKNFDKMINLHSSPDVAKRSVAQSLNFAKLKAMHKKGDNPELTKKFKEIMDKHDVDGVSDKIENDNELSTI